MRRYSATCPDAALLTLTPKALLRLPRHVSVRQPRWIANHYLGFLVIGRQPNRAAQVARYISPDVITPRPPQLAQRRVGFGQRAFIFGRQTDAPLALQPSAQSF